MRTAATIKLNDMAISTIQLGFVGESNHNKIVFDCEAVFSENPSAVQSITVTPPVGDPYPVVSARVGNNVEWIVGESDVAVEGDGKVQLTFIENNETIKSYEANTTIMVSSVPGQEPTAIADWITAANATLEEVDDAIPTGGTKGQVLAKASNADRDTEWVSYSGSYNDMSDKPQIEGVTLSGDVSLQDLGAAAAEDIPDVSGFYTKPASGIPASDLATGVIPDVSGFYSKPQTGIPATDIADGVIPDVSGFYTKPATGIPASDLATGVIPDVSGYYTKPNEGIPDTDMSTGVRTSLGKADSAYQKPGSGIPAGDLASGVIPDVSGFYTKPAGGIPAADIASGVIPDPTDIIDDTAGDGATQLTWSADKIKEETDGLKSAIVPLQEEVTDLDEAVFCAGDEEQESENLFDKASSDMMLSFEVDEFGTAQNLHGFYVPVSDYQGDLIFIKRTYDGEVLRGAFSSDVPASGVSYVTDGKWTTPNEEKRCVSVRVPEDANYLYVSYYNASSDVLTQSELLEGMLITQADESVTNLFTSASEDMLLTCSVSSGRSGTYGTGTRNVGFYVPVDPSVSDMICIERENKGKILSVCFCADVPASGKAFTNYARAFDDSSCMLSAIIPNNANYAYVRFRDNQADTLTRDQLIAGMKVKQMVRKTTTVTGGKKSRIEQISSYIFTGESPAKTNLFEQASDDMMLAFDAGTYAQATSLHGFYVPVDPSKGTVTIKKRNPGTVLRSAFSTNVPAVGVSYTNMLNAEANAVVERVIPEGAAYLYIGYYNSQNDTLTQAELIDGMEIYYGEEDESKPKESIINRMTYRKDVTFENGYMDSTGKIVQSEVSVISSEIVSRGRSRVCVSSSYKVKLCLLSMDGTGAVITEEITNKVFWFDHYGLFRIVIANADGTNIEPDDVNFAKLKFRTNEVSAEAFANINGKVLDAETARVDELYEYIDSAVKTHGNYVTKTLLCTETTGLPINYYTLGSGATKVLIVTGQHSPPRDPKDSVITVAKLMHDLITCNFTAGSFLQKLHDECTLLVIPLMNPYGFEHNVDLTYEGVNLNSDWVTQSTEVVQLASSLITTFDPDIGLDIHCNGSTPLDNENIGIQFNLASDNTDVYNAVHTYFEKYYNTPVNVRTDTAENTLRHFITQTLGKPGGLIECRWFLKSSETLHDEQVETINYSMLVNVLKWFVNNIESETYSFEVVPNQNQY